MPQRRSHYLVSDPSKGNSSGLSFNESWLKTLRKYFGRRDFDAELNTNIDGLAELIVKASEPALPSTYHRRKDVQLEDD